MEPDEQGLADETAYEETQEQTTDLEDTSSEAVKTQSDGTERGDLRIPLKEERERRRALEARLSDPDFIYERARALGMAQGEEPTAPKEPEAPLTPAQARAMIRAEKAFDKHPELRTNDKLRRMAAALVDGGMDPVDAADEVFSMMSSKAEEAKVEGKKEAQSEITEREKAQMVGNTVRTDSESERAQDIRKRMKSYDRSTQEQATLEWLKARNDKEGVL